MGYKLTWMAAQNADEAAVLERLGFEIAGEVEDYDGAPYTLGRLPGGWLVIVSVKQAPFEKLAAKAVPEGFVLTGFLNETVMVSEARGFRDGAVEWAVVHDPEVEANGVQIEGEPPAAFAEIHQRLQAEQAKSDEGDGDVDYIFDAPIQLSTAICGFAHDREMDVTWMALLKAKRRDAPEAGKGFFARLFGR